MNRYAAYSREQIEELQSHYLIDSWSYSKVATFARNEKSFEKQYVYYDKEKRSVSSIAGNAYHESLRLYFTSLRQDGTEISLPEMEESAFSYIDNVPANEWKPSKTCPTVEECRIKAFKSVSSLLRNFYGERTVYTDSIGEVLGVELSCREFLTVNGVDIPLPCNAVIDLVFRHKDGRVIIVDHKTRSRYTDEEEVAFTCGKQAVTYLLAYEAKEGITADEVWFVENKESVNKNGSPQLARQVMTMDTDSRRLYEALLYEPLRRMVEAVSDPDYVFVANDTDSLCDRGALFSFWAKTMIAEVSDFDIPENKKELIARRQRKIRDASLAVISPKTISLFKKKAASFIKYDLTDTDMSNPEKIEHVLRTFGILTQVAHEMQGHSSCTYLLEASAGVKISQISKYRLDIANALNVPSVRIGDNLVVYEGKSYLPVEAPVKGGGILYWDVKYLEDKNRIPLGVDNFGNVICWDIHNHATPHMLICGATGSGKSVSIISTVEYALEAGINDITIFDPKYEFCGYASRPGVKVYNEIEDIEEQMRLCVEDMQSRARTGVHQLKLIVFDEFADAVASAKSGAELDIKEMVEVGQRKGDFGMLVPKMELRTTGRLKSLEENLKMLLQKGRSLGFRIIAATQRASANVITGDAKVNFPVLVCFRVPKEIDSKVVLDEPGAETLNGKGDGLIKSPEYFGLVRFQGFYKPNP